MVRSTPSERLAESAELPEQLIDLEDAEVLIPQVGVPVLEHKSCEALALGIFILAQLRIAEQQKKPFGARLSQALDRRNVLQLTGAGSECYE
jgi:hypothetical protein